MRIGPYELEAPWVLAPMAGVTDMPFRLIARASGAAAAVSEMVSAKGLMYGQPLTLNYLRHDSTERPFWVQIFGGDPESMAAGAERAAELGAGMLDINMGCPVKKVVRTGAGSALMREPQRAAAIVGAVVRRTGLPVTVKIRSGWDASEINAVDVARAVADSGCSAITVHGRTRAQGYSGRASWQVIAEVVRSVSVPVIGNGDVRDPADGPRMLSQTGCAGVMIGRGALGRPWIFSGLSGDGDEPNAQQRGCIARDHLLSQVEHVGDEGRALRQFRSHLAWYARGLPGCAQFRQRLCRATSLPDVLELCEEFFDDPVNRLPLRR